MKRSFYNAIRLCGLFALTRYLAGALFLAYNATFDERIFEEPLTNLTGWVVVGVYPISFFILTWLIFYRKGRKADNFPIVSLISLVLSASANNAEKFGQNLALVFILLAFAWLLVAVLELCSRIGKKEIPARSSLSDARQDLSNDP